MIHYGSGNAASVSGSGRAARNGQGRREGGQGAAGASTFGRIGFVEVPSPVTALRR
jgi:hypothetical protein